MSHTLAAGRRTRRGLQVWMLLWAAATIACQAVFADSPTPVQPLHRPPQPATARPPGVQLNAPTATAGAGVQLNAPTAAQGGGDQLNAPTVAPPPGADYQAQS